jgi:uncharacterized protein (DUF58 family)
VLFWYGATSEVAWLLLLAWWVLALIVAAAGYAAWNRTALDLHMSVRNSVPGPGSPSEELPEQLLRSGPSPAPVFEGDGFGLEVAFRAARGPRGPVWALGQVGDKKVGAATGLVPTGGWSDIKEMVAVRRGPVSAHAWRMGTSDPLGFFVGVRRVPESEVALILPRFASLAGRRPARELEAAMAAPRAGSGNELFGIREYRPGDSLRRIHWRSSARHGELVVREYEPPGVPTLTILVDPAPPTVEIADQVARIAASEAWDRVREGGRVVLWGPGLEPTRPERELWPLLEWLARYPTSPSGPLGHLPTSGEDNMIVVSANPALLNTPAIKRWVVGDAAVATDIDFERVGTQWPL